MWNWICYYSDNFENEFLQLFYLQQKSEWLKSHTVTDKEMPSYWTDITKGRRSYHRGNGAPPSPIPPPPLLPFALQSPGSVRITVSMTMRHVPHISASPDKQ